MIQSKLYPHHVGHYLGCNVHDTPDISRTSTFVPGTIITIEPGIYIPNDPQFPVDYQGIGIRIEDDVLITNDQPFVLTLKAPKEIQDIEKIMAQ